MLLLIAVLGSCLGVEIVISTVQNCIASNYPRSLKITLKWSTGVRFHKQMRFMKCCHLSNVNSLSNYKLVGGVGQLACLDSKDSIPTILPLGDTFCDVFDYKSFTLLEVNGRKSASVGKEKA